MHTFCLICEICITALRRNDYAYISDHENLKLEFIREPKNKFDENAILVHLDGKKIGYVNRNDAKILSPLLKCNNTEVREWRRYHEKSNDGYMIIHVRLDHT